MPRQRTGTFRSENLTDAVPRVGLIASARNFKTEPLKTTGRLNLIRNEEWQKLAWTFFDTITEYHYSVTVVANLLSRAKLYVTKDGERTEDATAVEALAALGNGPAGQTELLRQYGVHFTVAGDSYLIGMDRGGKSDWFVAAASEIKADPSSGIWKVGDEELLTTDLVIRAWRPHPQKRNLPDSPTRAVLPVLAEIDGLSKHVAASVDSRLIGSGILFLPEEMNIGKAPRPTIGEALTLEEVTEADSNSASDLMQEMIETASESLSDPGSAAAKVPIMVQVKGDTIKDIKWQTFWTDFDGQLKDLRQEAIRRLSLGMDMPPEMLTGTGDLNHWNSWQSEEASIKSHAEPLLAAVTDALTEGYLWPALGNDDEAKRYAIAADTTEMRLRPNRSQEAEELYDRGVLSVETLLRENGFDPINDRMGDEELKVWFLRKVASGSTTPELVAQALVALDIPGITVAAGETGGVTQETRPIPSLVDHPTRDIPDEDDSESVAASLVAPAFTMIDRALERAGNRIRNQMKGTRIKDGDGRDVSAVETYRFVRIDFTDGLLNYLLEDAWGQTERFAATFGLDGKWLRNALDTYARELIQFSRKNDVQALHQHLVHTLKTRPERIGK